MAAKASMPSQSSLLQLLNSQYEHVESYCNAQTRLQNALTEGNRSKSDPHQLYQAKLNQHVTSLQKTLGKVQSDLVELEGYNIKNERLQQLLDSHVERSKRVLTTIYRHGGIYHANGLPAGKDSIEEKTVALSALKASITQIQRVIGEN
jgi:hypothetical protein